MEQTSPLSPQGQIAVDFANALVAEDYSAAHALLTGELQQKLTPDSLRSKLYGMFEGYAQGKPERIWFDEATNPPLEVWPGKRPGDVCRAYVGIEGEDFNEAVDLLIVRQPDGLRIREIFWGRP
jgi:hypothetical protein